jgi:hypothetical protein
MNMRRTAVLTSLIIAESLLLGCTDKPCDFGQLAKDEVARRDPHASRSVMTVRSIQRVKGLIIVSLRADGAQHPGAIAGFDPETCRIQGFAWDFEG